MVRTGKINHRLVGKARQSARTGRNRADSFAPLGTFPLGGDGWVLQQFSDLGVLGKALAQERFIGGVLQQSADQITHAGHHIPVGAVKADAAGHLEDALAHRLGHAVQDLELVTRFGNIKLPGHFHDSRNGADVVGCAGKMTDLLVFKDQSRLTFKGGIALGLDGPDRDGPAVLLGLDRLVIPVGAFYQADGDLCLVLFCPADQVDQILVSVPEIGLQDDADVGVVPVFQLQAAVEFDDDCLVAVAFHVDTQETVQLNHLVTDPAHLLQHGLDRALEILGIGQGKERGRLDRHIHPWGVAPVQVGSSACPGQSLPALLLFFQAFQNLEIGANVLFGLFIGQGRFAQYIDNSGKTVLAQFFYILDRFFGVFSDDELAGHLLDIGGDHFVENRPPQGTKHTGHLCPGLEHRRHILLFAEILADVVGKQLTGGQ